MSEQTESRDSAAVEQVMRLMLASSCFGLAVCPVPPCACARSLVDAVSKVVRERCAQIAEAIDAGRGNEKAIARATRQLT